MNTRICADSTCDLSPELTSRYGVVITPLYVSMGDKSYRDGDGCVPEDIYNYYDRTKKLCTTAAVTIGDYIDVFSRELETHDAIVHFTISSDMSGCYQNALEAAGEFGGRVWVVDSRNLSVGIGHLVLDAAVMAGEGCSAQEIFERMEQRKEKINASFVIDTLEYLHRGGRCSGVAALGANMLRLKPVIEVTNGFMTVGKKYRGSMEKTAVSYVLERLGSGSGADLERVFLVDSGVQPELTEKVGRLLAEAGFREILRTRAGCTIACHCGPGALGIFYYNK